MNGKYPEEGEFVIGTVVEIHPYGTMVELDDYNKRGMIHIREISSGWVKNIRNHVKMGQKVVTKVLKVDPSKGHINLSLKRVSDRQRKVTIQQSKLEKKGKKLLEYFAEKNEIPAEIMRKEIMEPLRKRYGYVYDAFEEALIHGKEILKEDIPEEYIDDLYELLSSTVEVREVEIKSNMNIECYEPEGIDVIKNVIIPEDSNIKVTLQGSPNYSVKVTSHDYKTAEEILAEYTKGVKKAMDGHEGTVTFERVKK